MPKGSNRIEIETSGALTNWLNKGKSKRSSMKGEKIDGFFSNQQFFSNELFFSTRPFFRIRKWVVTDVAVFHGCYRRNITGNLLMEYKRSSDRSRFGRNYSKWNIINKYESFGSHRAITQFVSLQRKSRRPWFTASFYLCLLSACDDIYDQFTKRNPGVLYLYCDYIWCKVLNLSTL